MTDIELRTMFDAVTSPFANSLVHALGDIQKDGSPDSYRGDWKEFVIDVLNGVDMLDAGQFPDHWYSEEDQ